MEPSRCTPQQSVQQQACLLHCVTAPMLMQASAAAWPLTSSPAGAEPADTEAGRVLVALVSDFAAEAAMEAWVLLVELVTAVAMVAPVAWAGVTCAEVAFRVVTFAAGGAEPGQQWSEASFHKCRQRPGHSEPCASS